MKLTKEIEALEEAIDAGEVGPANIRVTKKTDGAFTEIKTTFTYRVRTDRLIEINKRTPKNVDLAPPNHAQQELDLNLDADEA